MSDPSHGLGEQRYRHALRRLTAELSSELAALPFAREHVVVAAGDSITADVQSWARILGTALGRQLVEAGVSGDTSVHLISRLAAIVERSPHWLLVLIGTNDARRHGPAAGPLVSDEQFRANLAAIRA